MLRRRCSQLTAQTVVILDPDMLLMKDGFARAPLTITAARCASVQPRGRGVLLRWLPRAGGRDWRKCAAHGCAEYNRPVGHPLSQRCACARQSARRRAREAGLTRHSPYFGRRLVGVCVFPSLVRAGLFVAPAVQRGRPLRLRAVACGSVVSVVDWWAGPVGPCLGCLRQLLVFDGVAEDARRARDLWRTLPRGRGEQCVRRK